MIPRIRSTHLRHSQRTHYQQQQQHQHQNPSQQHQLLLQRHHRQLELYAESLNDFDNSNSSSNSRRSPPGSARSLEEGEPPDIDIVRKQQKEEVKFAGNLVIIKFAGINKIDRAMEMRNKKHETQTKPSELPFQHSIFKFAKEITT